MGEYSTETRLFTWVVHDFDNYESALSEGGALAVVVPGFPPTPHQTRDNTEFPRMMGQNEARLCPVRPPRPAGAARRTRGGDGGGSDPILLAADAPRGRGRLFMPLFILFPLPLGVAPTNVIPCGKAIEPAKRPALGQRNQAGQQQCQWASKMAGSDRCPAEGAELSGDAHHPGLSLSDAENACPSPSGAAFRESLQPQRRGLRPLRERRCA